MYRFYKSLKDATIYLLQPDQNTGRDEILEINKTFVLGQKDISRPLIKFDVNDISSSIATGEITSSVVELLLKETESSEVPTDYTIFVYPVSQSWDMGIGTKFDIISTENVTWNTPITDGFWATGSYDSGSIGGTWYTGSLTVSQSLEYESSDLLFEISTPLNAWISGSIPNEGFILKLDDAVENNTNDYGSLKYFSKETNTIYQPKIRIGWDDQTFSTGSLTELTSDDIKVTFKKLRSRYNINSLPTIRVFGREKYPLKTYTNQYAYNDITYLPITTYYQIKDAQTDEIVVPYGKYSKVSCDENGNFINLNFKNWETNRSYYIEIKVDRNGIIEFFSDHNLTFTIEK